MRVKKRSETDKFPPNTFGGNVERFTYFGLHPHLMDLGTIKTNPDVGPGSYNPEIDRECSYKKKSGPYFWKLKLDTELWTENLGYICKDQLAAREQRKKQVGPATYEINVDYGKPKSFSVRGDKDFGRSERFKTSRFTTPGPGTHDKDVIKNSSVNHPNFTSVPIFEWSGLGPRFKDTEKSYKLAPNRYKICTRGTIDETLNKRVSHLKGPYDLFTGPRDDTTIKNYFAAKDKSTPDYYYVHPSDLDFLLHDRSRKRYGCFLKCKRYPKHTGIRMLISSISNCYKDPNQPGPGYYTVPDRTWQSKKSNFPFGSNKERDILELPWKISPGPGRYGRSVFKRISKKPTCVFMSETDRFPRKKDPYTFYADEYN